MIDIKTTQEINKLAEGGKILATILKTLKKETKPGVEAEYINQRALNLAKEYSAVPSFYNYKGYPANICISINNEVVHGIPGDRIFNKGDLVSLDFGLRYQGLYTDMAITFALGRANKKVKELLKVTRESLRMGIEQVKPGNRVGDIANAIESYIKKTGFSIVRDLTGHGVGRAVHEDPQIPNFGNPHTGPVLREGMVIAIEPMVNIGGSEVQILKDGWTFVTKDNSLSAHFEHTVAVTRDGYKVLTSL